MNNIVSNNTYSNYNSYSNNCNNESHTPTPVQVHALNGIIYVCRLFKRFFNNTILASKDEVIDV